VACLLCNVIAGISAGFYVVPLYSLYHARCREEFRGRFWGLENSLRTASTCGGFLIAGILAQRLPLSAIFTAAAAIMLLMAVWAQGLRSSAAPMPQA
jgi:NhaP-type Na+/H+ or K+/H+ antiporter